MLKSRISGAPRRTLATITSALLSVSALVGASAYVVTATDTNTTPVVDTVELANVDTTAETAPGAVSESNPSSLSSSSTDLFDLLFAIGKIFEAPAPAAVKEKVSTPVEMPKREFPYAIQGDVVDIAGEAVYVCATGNGYGLSHVGATLLKGADAEATRAESARLCGTALRVAGAVVVANGARSELLTTPRIIESGGRYECNPVEPGVLRCAADDGSLFTLWDVAY